MSINIIIINIIIINSYFEYQLCSSVINPPGQMLSPTLPIKAWSSPNLTPKLMVFTTWILF